MAAWKYWFLSRADALNSAKKGKIHPVFSCRVCGQAWSALLFMHRYVKHTVNLLLLCSFSLCPSRKRQIFFNIPPNRVLGPGTETSKSWGVWCVCVSHCVGVCICWPTFTQWERGRALKVLPPSFLPTLSAPASHGCTSGYGNAAAVRKGRGGSFFFSPFFSVFSFFPFF